MKFTIKLPCKSWVFKYIENNFGNPANFHSNLFLSNLIKNSIEKPRGHRHKVINSQYTKEIEIEISSEQFYSFGWELSQKSIIEINRIIELQIKALCLIFVSISTSFGKSIKDSIFDFQKQINFTDTDWNYHSIAKYLQRNLPKYDFKKNLDNFLTQTINDVQNRI